MADLHQVITLGIGTPSSVPHFLLLGLTVNPSVIAAVADVTIRVRPQPTVILVRA